ncbi:MAG TPA: 2-aminoethylphosphonate--pyruvate transaminase [Geminicoccaceae bacterium]|nr:2-aminoethylphosphonate--pyruvate transaminase [Geminicoccaceae bacterium]
MIILSPGPVTTGDATKAAMLRDFSPNQPELLGLTAELRRRLVEIAHGGEDYSCVMLQGAGNTANEAVLGTLVPRDRRVLVVVNGHYGARLVDIARAIGVPCTGLALSITEPVQPGQVEAALAADPSISHLAVCHVDTGAGLLNPIEPLAELARRRHVGLLVDAIASFGGLPLDARALGAEAIVLSPNKWLEGVPGMALTLVRRTALAAAAGRSHSFCLDLYRQWRSHEEHGAWRFTPPTQAIAALAVALRRHAEEGREARLARVGANWRTLVDGMRALGFATVLRDEVAAPVIATFHAPADPRWDRERFFELMRARGFVIFRGSLTPFPSLRIGCMGAFDQATMRQVVAAVEAALAAMGVTDCRPATRPEAA